MICEIPSPKPDQAERPLPSTSNAQSQYSLQALFSICLSFFFLFFFCFFLSWGPTLFFLTGCRMQVVVGTSVQDMAGLQTPLDQQKRVGDFCLRVEAWAGRSAWGKFGEYADRY